MSSAIFTKKKKVKVETETIPIKKAKVQRLVRRERLQEWVGRGYRVADAKDQRNNRKRLLGVKTFDEMVLVEK